jgi:uncharacterized protein YoxC
MFSDLFPTAWGVALSSGKEKLCRSISHEARGGAASSDDTPLIPPPEESSALIGNSSENEYMYVCAICLGSIWKKKFGICDPCGHVLHQSCFCEWAMTRKSFFFYEQEQQQTKCPVCNTGVHKMRNIYWTSSSGGEDMGHDDDINKLEDFEDEGKEEDNSNDCSYFAYLENRIQEETAAIKLRISLLEEQVQFVKNQNATLTEQVEQVLLDINRLKEDVEQEKQRRIELSGQSQSEQQLGQSYRGNSFSDGRNNSSRRASKRKREVGVAAAARADDGCKSSKKK